MLVGCDKLAGQSAALMTTVKASAGTPECGVVRDVGRGSGVPALAFTSHPGQALCFASLSHPTKLQPQFNAGLGCTRLPQKKPDTRSGWILVAAGDVYSSPSGAVPGSWPASINSPKTLPLFDFSFITALKASWIFAPRASLSLLSSV